MRLTHSQARTEHPATPVWFALAVLRLRLRMSPRQLELWRRK